MNGRTSEGFDRMFCGLVSGCGSVFSMVVTQMLPPYNLVEAPEMPFWLTQTVSDKPKYRKPKLTKEEYKELKSDNQSMETWQRVIGPDVDPTKVSLVLFAHCTTSHHITSHHITSDVVSCLGGGLRGSGSMGFDFDGLLICWCWCWLGSCLQNYTLEEFAALTAHIPVSVSARVCAQEGARDYLLA